MALRVYVGSTWENKEAARAVMAHLGEAGFKVTHDWTGQEMPVPDWRADPELVLGIPVVAYGQQASPNSPFLHHPLVRHIEPCLDDLLFELECLRAGLLPNA